MIPPPAWAVDDDGKGIELRRARPGERAFGYEITLIRGGAFSKAVEVMYGFGAAARAAYEALAAEQAEKMIKALAFCRTDQTRALVGALHAVAAAELRPHGSGYRAQGPDVFFGVQHEFHPTEKDKHGKARRIYIRKQKQGGLAKRFGVCVRTLQRAWAVLVRFGVWSGCRPPRNAKDAMLTKSGAQVYTQRWLVNGTPRAIIDRLPLYRKKRAARRPDASNGRPMRVDELKEAKAFIDGELVELPPDPRFLY